MNEKEIIELLSSKALPSHAKWAKANDMSQQYVSKVIAGKLSPGPKILDAIGYQRVVTYVPKPKGE